MPNPRKLDKRRKSVRNIRKITRTMELIATARFKKAMDRATAASAYTRQITRLVADLAASGSQLMHPLMDARPDPKRAILLVLTGNRGLCGGYNSTVVRQAILRWNEWQDSIPERALEVSGKRGIAAFRYRKIQPNIEFMQFEDRPKYEEVELIANRYMASFESGELDRLDVAYTRFISVSRQRAVVETLLPLGSLSEEDGSPGETRSRDQQYEYHPSAEAILQEVVPASFRVKLFKCFLDAAVSEQIARMVAMKSATENAGELIRNLSMTYNRARQSRITSEIMDIVGGVEALKS
jgi:F-type H+-transporting ATPase subunit gamma